MACEAILATSGHVGWQAVELGVELCGREHRGEVLCVRCGSADGAARRPDDEMSQRAARRAARLCGARGSARGACGGSWERARACGEQGRLGVRGSACRARRACARAEAARAARAEGGSSGARGRAHGPRGRHARLGGVHSQGQVWRNHPKLLGPGALIFVAKQL